MGQYIDKDALVAEIERRKKYYENIQMIKPVYESNIEDFSELLSFIKTLEVKEVNEKSETACRSKIIKVKCISPFDETWEKGKVYTGEKWHHGDLDMDFWDIYYDYGSNPKYVQFSSFEMLEKEFVVLKNDTLEVKEVELYNNGWIDCTKQMPPETKQTSDTLQGHREWTESDMVLVWDSMYGCSVDITKNGKWMSERRGGYTGQLVHGIIAWRPIPKFSEELLLKA